MNVELVLDFIQNNMYTPMPSKAAQSRIVPAQKRLAVVTKVWYRSSGANPFLMGHGRMVRTPTTAVSGEGCL